MKWSLVLAAWSTAAWVLSTPAAASNPAVDQQPLSYVIVVTGGELLEGTYTDAHTPFLTRALRPLGCVCVGAMVVDDRREDIHRALHYGTNRAPLVIVTGGLGPTPNDITRETLSEFTGIPLHEDPDALADLERRFNQTRDQIRPNLRKQMLVPTRGGYLKNPEGTAVGLLFDSGTHVVAALPGPPRELQSMVRRELIPFLQKRFGVREFGSSLTLRFVGAGQSLIDQTLKDQVGVAPDVTITSVFEGGRVDFTFSLAGNTPADRTRLHQLEEKIRTHLGRHVYASDSSSLEQVLLQKVRDRGGSLVLVEVGSGGALAAALSTASGGASVLTGAYVASSDEGIAKLLGEAPGQLSSVPEDRAKHLATVAAARNDSQYAITVGPVQSDSTGNWLWIFYKFPEDRWEKQRVPLRGSGELMRATLATQVFDYLRLHLP